MIGLTRRQLERVRSGALVLKSMTVCHDHLWLLYEILIELKTGACVDVCRLHLLMSLLSFQCVCAESIQTLT